MSVVTTEELWDRIRAELDTLRAGIDDRLTTETSAVRFDFGHVLRTELGGIRTELRDFRGEFDTFRDDALTHFDNIYGRLDAQAMEHQALSAAVARLEQRRSAP
jgi:hypothetical protein